MSLPIDEANKYMTVYYSKSTGYLKRIFSGVQHMNVALGDEYDDYSIIWAEAVYLVDANVINHYTKYKVNLDTMLLQLIEEIPAIVDNTPITPEQLQTLMAGQ